MKSFKSIRFFSKKAVCLLIISCFIFSCCSDDENLTYRKELNASEVQFEQDLSNYYALQNSEISKLLHKKTSTRSNSVAGINSVEDNLIYLRLDSADENFVQNYSKLFAKELKNKKIEGVTLQKMLGNLEYSKKVLSEVYSKEFNIIFQQFLLRKSCSASDIISNKNLTALEKSLLLNMLPVVNYEITMRSKSVATRSIDLRGDKHKKSRKQVCEDIYNSRTCLRDYLISTGVSCLGGPTPVTAIGVAVSIYQYVNCEYSATDNYKKCMGK